MSAAAAGSTSTKEECALYGVDDISRVYICCTVYNVLTTLNLFKLNPYVASTKKRQKRSFRQVTSTIEISVK